MAQINRTRKARPKAKVAAGQHVADLAPRDVEAVFAEAVAEASAEHDRHGVPMTGEQDGKLVRRRSDGEVETIVPSRKTKDPASAAE